jgi:endonuclease YncB( thermonuclease family)
MKRFRNCVLIVLLISILFSSISLAEPIKVNVNGNQLSLTVNPVSKDGRTLVPLRAIFEALGATVEWEQSTNTVTGVQGNKIVKLQIDNKVATVDGKEIILDVPAIAINGSTFVPVRFIAESLGAKVDWDNNTKTVIVNSITSTENIKTYKVTRVVDGDTIKVNFNGKEESVRLIGIDTPESVHPDASKNLPEGKLASQFTKDKLEGKEITLEFDVQERDKYGRLLAYAWIGGEMFNKTLLEEGYAQLATFPPNVKYVEEFTQLQETAREGNKGLWNNNMFNAEANLNSTNVPEVKTIGKYVGSIESDKYHYPSCRWAEKILKENEIWFDTIEEAKEQGYQPCGVCKPFK